MLHGQILVILKGRKVTPTPGAFLLRDEGRGPFIADWDTATLGQRPTPSELDAISEEQAALASSKVIATRDLLRRITDDEWDALTVLGESNKKVKRLLALLTAAPMTDVHSLEFLGGWMFIKSVGIPAIWPDGATATARIAVIGS